MDKKVSIVVPIYNVEKELNRCLDSIVNQTYKNLEIILVNDGSKDKSEEIAKQFSLIDNRINFYNKENGGLSDARNFGIEKATGKYLLFVDSDDYIDSEAVNTLVKTMEINNLDIILGNAIKEEEEKKISLINPRSSNNLIMRGEDYFATALKNKQYNDAVWLNMYSTELIKKNKIYFIKGQLHEDINWTPKVLIIAKKVMFINFPFYHYIIRENSITQQKDFSKNKLHKMMACEDLSAFYDKNEKNIKEKNLKIYREQLIYIYITSFFLKSKKKYKINKMFLVKNAKTKQSKIKVFLFLIHPTCYQWFQKKRSKK